MADEAKTPTPSPDFEAGISAAKEKALEAVSKTILKDASKSKGKSGASNPSKEEKTKENTEEADEDTSEEEETEDEESEDDENEDDEEESSSAENLKKEVKALFKKWDLPGIEKKLGLEKGSLNKDKNFARLRVHQNQVDEASEKLAKDQEEWKKVQSHNQEVLVKKYGNRVQLDQAAANGDIKTYCEIIARDWNCDVNTFIRAYTKNVASVSVREKDLEKKLSETEARLKKLESGGTQETEEKDDDEDTTKDEVRREKAVKNVKNYLKEALADTDALQLKDGLDIAFEVYINNFDPVKKACKLSPQAIAKEVLKEKRRQLEEDSWVRTGKKPKKKEISRTVSRQEANVSQTRKKNISKEQAMEIFVKQMARDKAAS